MRIAPYVVGYLDLLGFSSELLTLEEDPSHLMGQQLKFRLLKMSCAELIRSFVQRDIDVRWLSDSCVVAALAPDLSEELIAQAIADVSTALGIIQCRFGSEDYFSRGGIAIGRMAQSVNEDGTHGPLLDEELFGPGLVRAGEIEKSLAKVPCVLISARLVAWALKLTAPISGRSMYKFSFPLPFLDYLSFAECIWNEHPDEVLAGHAELVHNLVVKSQRVPSLRHKARWLLEYHNNHIQSRKDIDHLIIRLDPPPLPAGDEVDPEPQLTMTDIVPQPNALHPVAAYSFDNLATDDDGLSIDLEIE